MRGLIVLCLCAVGLAAPQGYSYNQGSSGGSVGIVSVQQPSIGGLIGSFGVAPVTAGGGFFSNGPAAQHTNFGGYQQQHHQQQPIVSKRFFIHSAPEDVEEEYKEQQITVGVPRKNYNVVFIKAPARSHKKTAIKISPASNEEKTVIYVLSKKADASDIQAEVVEHATATSKPEVFFIKYKTNEEANHAQAQIQAQYDALGGTSQVTDEGIAPVTSIVGSLGGGDAGAVGSSVNAHGSGSTSLSSGPAQTSVSNNNSHATSNAYLPPNFY